ncbi:ferredoxin--NADP reductase [Derxia gummosa]|uniref:ferredoxin--NADP(+) reductase n=1 Tax=Derxia gummosa DSM 723 TaxID=1121388 RepID=A0A8B6X250_9BURK|nr:ferredoxin--NADP reductase [Derxia gummosa]
MPPDKYTRETITWIKPWTPHLFSFRTTRSPGFRFIPGQFARLGVWREDGDPAEKKGPRWVWRAYSIASANYDEFLEFYSIVVPDGEFTTKLASLKVGDEVLVEKTNYGFLTTDRFEGGRELWLLSSGTGLAPFISILLDLAIWEQYERIVVVHSVRHADELAYRDTIEGLKDHEAFGELLAESPGKVVYLPLITREQGHWPDGRPMLAKRITTALADGSLAAEAGVPLDPATSRVMICGNPTMVDDIRKQLAAMGFAVSRRGVPGTMAVENYW